MLGSIIVALAVIVNININTWYLVEFYLVTGQRNDTVLFFFLARALVLPTVNQR